MEENRKRTVKLYNMDIVSPYMNSTDFWEMPIISNDKYIPSQLIGFNEVLTSKVKNTGVHFFLDDYQFERLWKEPSRYVNVLNNFDCILSPDFSLYLDMPRPLQIYNTYRNRLLGRYYQEKGLKVIPTISWGDKKTFNFCFKGIPSGSVVAISTIGVRKEKETFKIWEIGKNEMIKQIKPSVILIYGGYINTDTQGIKTIWYENKTIKRMKENEKRRKKWEGEAQAVEENKNKKEKTDLVK